MSRSPWHSSLGDNDEALSIAFRDQRSGVLRTAVLPLHGAASKPNEAQDDDALALLIALRWQQQTRG